MPDTRDATEAGGTAKGTTGTNATGNVLTNDTDVDSVANGETKVVSAASGIRHTVCLGDWSTDVCLTNHGDGTYTYVINNNDGAVQALRLPAQTLTDSFTYTVQDEIGRASCRERV